MDVMQRLPLRERQRLEVRSELQQAALRLFAHRGYEQVSVTDIADEVGVVSRTFYRHFPTKEDAVLSLLDEAAPIVHEHVRSHPAGDAPWRVLADAVRASSEVHERVSASIMRMIFETPRLESAYYERQRRWEAMVARVLAERLGVPERDPRPTLWATMAFNIMTRVTIENVTSGRDVEPLAELDQRFAQAAEFFTGELR
jgi:AcrR family transcriptional regulator